MKTKTLWLTWLYLFALCGVLGFINEPPEFLKALFAVVGVGFFVPPVLLLMKKEEKTVRTIRLLSIIALVLIVVVFILNLASINMNSSWGNALDIIYRIVSTPMYCCQLKLLGLFGWACLMSASFFVKK